MPDAVLAAQFRRGRADYEQAGLVLAPLTARMALETVADVLPATSALQLRGEYNEDSLPILRIERVLDQAGRVLYEAAEGHPDPRAEETIDQVNTEYLDLLLDVTGDAYLGSTTIDRADLEPAPRGPRSRS